MEEREYPETFGEIVRKMPLRVGAFVWKLVSVQGVVLGLATWLVYEKRIESYAWLVACCLVLFGRYALDVIKEIRK